jgi:hypothetical protein
MTLPTSSTLQVHHFTNPSRPRPSTLFNNQEHYIIAHLPNGDSKSPDNSHLHTHTHIHTPHSTSPLTSNDPHTKPEQTLHSTMSPSNKSNRVAINAQHFVPAPQNAPVQWAEPLPPPPQLNGNSAMKYFEQPKVLLQPPLFAEPYAQASGPRKGVPEDWTKNFLKK